MSLKPIFSPVSPDGPQRSRSDSDDSDDRGSTRRGASGRKRAAAARVGLKVLKGVASVSSLNPIEVIVACFVRPPSLLASAS